MAGQASAATIYLNDPALTITSIGTIVVGAKYRLSPTNFDQSLDSGGGTNNVPGGTNFIATNRGNYPALNGTTFDFSFEHRAGEGFIFTMTSPAGASWTQAWGSFAPAVAADQLEATLRSSGADGNTPGDLVAPGAPYNALHLESRVQNRANITGPSATYSDLVFTTPGLTQLGALVTGFALVPGGGTANPNWPDPSTDFDSQWFVADTDLAGQDWTLSGKVTLATASFTGGNIDESLKFGISGKQVTFTRDVPAPAGVALFGLGALALAGARRR